MEENIMNMNEEVVEEAVENNEPEKKSFDLVKGAGILALAYLGGKVLYKRVGKPAYAKIKSKLKKKEVVEAIETSEKDDESEES